MMHKKSWIHKKVIAKKGLGNSLLLISFNMAEGFFELIIVLIKKNLRCLCLNKTCKASVSMHYSYIDKLWSNFTLEKYWICRLLLNNILREKNYNLNKPNKKLQKSIKFEIFVSVFLGISMDIILKHKSDIFGLQITFYFIFQS